MNSNDLRLKIRDSSKNYAESEGIDFDDSYKSALLFNEIRDNFLSSTFDEIQKNEDWKLRLKKPHQKVRDKLEMQSSNSSDALLMNIFCHPKISNWSGILKLLGLEKFNTKKYPKFGKNPGVELINNRKDKTEIDMEIDDIYFEAKLTESDFTEKLREVVYNYSNFKSLFHVDGFPDGDKFKGYQVIRNLLAAFQENKRHILLCDERRSDLARSYYEIVSNLKYVNKRKKCRVIFWQEIQRHCGEELKTFLKNKYGIY